MRNMSFALTTAQVRARTKTVTRRIGWETLRPGDHFMAIVKGQGIPKGGKVERICELVCKSNRRESLQMIILEKGGTKAEGFPRMRGATFVAFFMATHRERDGSPLTPSSIVSRIAFDYV